MGDICKTLWALYETTPWLPKKKTYKTTKWKWLNKKHATPIIIFYFIWSVRFLLNKFYDFFFLANYFFIIGKIIFYHPKLYIRLHFASETFQTHILHHKLWFCYTLHPKLNFPLYWMKSTITWVACHSCLSGT